MMAKYAAIEQTLELEDDGIRYRTFGILGKCGELELFVGDVSTQEHAVAELVERMNDGEASLCHLRDIVDDFLADL